MFKQIAVVVLLALGLTLAGCGKGSGNINGNWTASLTNPDGSPAFAFQTTLSGAGGGAFRVTSFTFNTAGACFASGQEAESGTVSLSGDYNGNVTGSFGMVITTLFPGATQNVLTLQGVVNGNKITGTWTLVGGAGCSGAGNFTATKA
jgi:hypothetical protein